MIKCLRVVCVFIIAAFTAAAAIGEAEGARFTLDGVIYETRGDELWVAGFDDEAETIVYRDKLDGQDVHVSWDYVYDAKIGEHVNLNTPKSVKTLVIDEGIVKLDDGFEWDTLETLKLPASLQVLGYGMFASPALKTIEVAEGSRYFSIYDGALVNLQTSELALYPAGRSVDSFTLPSVVKSVNSDIFSYETRIREIIVPEGVTKIESLHWALTESTERISLPASLTDMGMPINNTGSALKRIDVAPANPVYYSVEGVVYTRDGDFLCAYPTAQTKAMVVDDEFMRRIEAFTEVYGGFFYDNPLIEAAAFMTKELTEVPYAMFGACVSLRQVALPLNLKKIGDSSFENCLSLESIALPSGLEIIGSYSFFNCPKLKTVVIPDSVTEIGENAFFRPNERDDRKPDGPTLICKYDSAGFWYAFKNNLPWAEKPGDTPRLINFRALRGYPAAVISGETGSVTKLLEEPRANARSMGAYPNGVTVLVVEEKGEYARVRLHDYQGLEGYIPLDKLTLTDDLTGAIPITEVKNLGNRELPAKLSVYSAMDESSPATVVDLGIFDTLLVEDILGVWLYVHNEDESTRGFVRAQDVTAGVSDTYYSESPWDDYGVGYAIVVNPNSSDRLNLRQRPSVDSPSLGRYFNGTQVMLLGNSGNEWLRVLVDGKEGYMMWEYLRLVVWVNQLALSNG
ncbi:MAG: leucine-rich repeat protein [Oscillospiraceae bacterium]|jgi:uncharacterized protein YgiM (DUF1202 family)|nr:leucine-rich repeat protein [Oscillospiraceae bacterium]